MQTQPTGKEDQKKKAKESTDNTQIPQTTTAQALASTSNARLLCRALCFLSLSLSLHSFIHSNCGFCAVARSGNPGHRFSIQLTPSCASPVWV